MTCISDTNSSRHLSPRLAAGLVLSAFLVLGTSLTSASAEGRRDDHRGGNRPGVGLGGGGGGGGYYPAPPVVYGTPYYAPPPVVYGPAVGVYLPGVTIGIQ
jgi:hypothetical protein